MRSLLGWYYRFKYSLFRRERRYPARRGLIVLQIDALSHADLRRALDLGYCPTIARLLRDGGYSVRHWYCGLPSATPYCQAGIMYGENARIPAFRFYDKQAHRVITCNAPQGVQYIRDRKALPITRDYMLETEQRYRELAAKPPALKKPRSPARRKALEASEA